MGRVRTGIVVGDGETWRFFQDLYQELLAHHQVNVFNVREIKAPFFYYRLNRMVFQRDLRNFLAGSDVIFFEWASGLLSAATRLPKTKPIVARLHRYEMFKWIHQVNWSAVDKVILVSQAMQRKFAARVPEYADRTIVVPPGVSTTKFQPTNKPFNGDIGVMGSLVPRKRVYGLLLVFYELVQRCSNLHLHIGGGPAEDAGDYYDALLSLCARLNLNDKVTFYGEVAEPSSWYRNIDIFVSNSYSEGLQVSPMEAMASGRYCLSHHWEGAEELLPQECLFYTYGELQEKILSYCDAPESEKRRCQDEMRGIACERFDSQVIARRLRGVIEECASTQAML